MIYLIVFIYLLFLVYKYDIEGKRRGYVFCYNSILIILICISGLRYKVGGDTLNYYEHFSDTPFFLDLFKFDFSEANYEPLWIILQSISKSIINDFVFFQVIHACIVNTIIFWFIKNNTTNQFTAVLLYYCGTFFYFNMEIMRESLAICIFLLAYNSYSSKNWIRFYIYAYFAYLFHSSAVILFLFPLIQSLRFNFKGICVTLIFLVVSSYLSPLIELGLIYSKISDKFVLYSETKKLNVFGIISGFLLTCLVPYFFIFFYEKILRFYNKFRNLIFAYFFLAILSLAVQGFYRFLNYILMFQILFLADFFIDILKKDNDLLRIKILFLSFFLLIILVPKIQYYYRDTSMWAEGTRKYNLYYPYSSVLGKKEYIFRKDIHNGTFYED